MLEQGRRSLENIDLAGWQALKSHWRAFILESFDRLEHFSDQPLQAHIVNERYYPGFRLQNIVLESPPGSLFSEGSPGWQIGLNLFLPLNEGAFIPIICPCGHGTKWQADHQLPPQILARHGFAAALFDMPMFGEKSLHNDHFIQGSQTAMVGVWSNLFFLLDAIRTADYLQTRSDIDFHRGMGVTGVSGGGFTTLFMALLDSRTRAIAPVCSVAPLGGHIIEGLYTGCPENYMFGQASLGIDFDHLLCLASPLPCLVVGGTQDNLFRPEQVTQSFEQARKIYTLEEPGSSERLEIYFEESPHSFTPTMAFQVVNWMHRWLSPESEERIAETTRPVEVELLPQADLDCGTARQTSGMLDFVRVESTRLRHTRCWEATAANIQSLLHLDPLPSFWESESTIAEQLQAAKWGYPGLRRYLLHQDGDLSIPVVEAQFPEARPGVVICFGDSEKTRYLYQNGGLFGLCSQVVAAELRGFGDLEPLPTDYDLYGWCGIDRALSDLVQLGGETVIGQQTGDALRVGEWIESLPNPAISQPVIYGHGEAALPALFAGLLSPRVKLIILDSFLCSFEALAVEPAPLWQRYAFLPGVLQSTDLPELLANRDDKRFLLINPTDATKKRLDQETACRLYGSDRSHIQVVVDHRIANQPGERPGWGFGDPRETSYLKLVIQQWLEVQDKY
jgi:hypothetical protein